MVNIIEVPLLQIADINRGATLSPASIKERTVSENTGIQYLSISMIQGNYIENNLPFLRNIEDREYKYLLKDNDIVLAKMGQPKFAFIKNIGNRKIISTQNLYVLRFRGNILPLYVKAFFESKMGMKRLEEAYVKNTVPTLPVKNLEKILVPLFPDNTEGFEIQKKFIEQYESEEIKESELFTRYEEQKAKRISLFENMINSFN